MLSQRRNETLWLLLTLKSLTIDRSPKTYQLIVENSNAKNAVHINQVFQHNYEYVYQLWPCKPAQRQLIKVQLFEVILVQGKEVLLKKGQATPLVRYSQEGDRFQFKGEQNGNACLMIMKFKVKKWSEVDDRKIQKPKLVETDNQDQSEQKEEQKKVLIQPQPLEEDFQKQKISLPPSNSRYLSITPNRSQISYIQRRQSHLSKKSRQAQSQIYKIEKQKQEEALSKKEKSFQQVEKSFHPKNAAYLLNKDKYLENRVYKRAQETSVLSQMNQAYNKQSLVEPIKIDKRTKTSVNFEKQRQPEVSELIKKRRAQYLINRVEPISKRPSLSPLPSQFLVPKPEVKEIRQEQLRKKESKAEENKIMENSEVKIVEEIPSNYIENKKTKEAQDERKINETFINQLSSSRNKLQQKQKQDQIVRVSNHPEKVPQNKEPLAEKQIPNIRRVKYVQIRPTIHYHTEPHPAQTTEVPYSQLERLPLPLNSFVFDINLHHFKAITYESDPKSRRRLYILFENKRFSTDRVASQLKTTWRQKIGLRNCKQSSFIYIRLYSCGEDTLEVQEGQASVSVRDLVTCKEDNYRAYIKADDQKIGIIEFKFDKIQIITGYNSQAGRHSENSFSLPQIKKQGLSPISKHRTSSVITSEPHRQPQKLSKGPAGHKKKTKLQSHKSQALNHERKQSCDHMTTGAAKVRERRLKLKIKGSWVP